MISGKIIKMFNPDLIGKIYQTIVFRLYANCDRSAKITHRANLFNHSGDRKHLSIGKHVVIDGTFDIYADGYLSIGDYSFIGRSRIYAANQITIGKYCLVSDNVCIMDSNLHPRSASLRERIAKKWADGVFPDVYTGTPNSPVTLGDHSWIGFGCSIMKGVTIGEGAIVGAGSVVTKDVPPWTIVAGNPARFIREVPEDER
jgi:acetyltransferase-like isoleucine patch superfamily enzyme